MPYITPEKRRRWARILEQIESALRAETNSPGDLNYLLSSIVKRYTLIEGAGTADYSLLNEIDGVLGLMQYEFRRKAVAPYEDKKEDINGPL